MKFRPMALWRMRISPGPGSPTSTSTSFILLGAAMLAMRTALLMGQSPVRCAEKEARILP
jgi:hypothetical protein